jgi:23S rRNA (cytidine1920-2'-O)/16S rRNA (cytidine1409-2'-O)-methyltransferase
MAMRLDMFVSEKYTFTRNKSQSFIKDGLISVNGKIIIKPSFEVSDEESIELKEDKKTHWVSRSAGKLDGFLDSVLRHCED